MLPPEMLPLLVLAALALFGAWFLFFRPPPKKSAPPPRADAQAAHQPAPHKPATTKPATAKLAKPEPKQLEPRPAEHPRLVAVLKGCSAPITGVGLSQCGRHIVAVSLDRTVRLFPSVDEPACSRPNPLRANLPLDHGTCVGLSASAKNVVVGTATGERVHAYSVALGGGGGAKPGLTLKRSWPVEGRAHRGPLVACLLAGTGAFVLTVGGEEDTEVHLWALNGTKLATYTNKQGEHAGAALSADARFVMLAAWTSDVKCLEVALDKSGAPTGLVPAMTFSAHRRGTAAVAFADDCAHAAICSKDGGWSVWRYGETQSEHAVRYAQGEEPKRRGKGEAPGGVPFERLSLSPFGKLLVGAAGPALYLVDVASGATLDTIGTAHPGGGVAGLAFSSDGTRVASGGADGRVKLWRAADNEQAGTV